MKEKIKNLRLKKPIKIYFTSKTMLSPCFKGTKIQKVKTDGEKTNAFINMCSVV